MAHYVVIEPSLARWTIRLTCRGQSGLLKALYSSPCGGQVTVTLHCRAASAEDNGAAMTLQPGAAGATVSFAAERLVAVEDGLRATAELVEQVLEGARISVAPAYECTLEPLRDRRRR